MGCSLFVESQTISQQGGGAHVRDHFVISNRKHILLGRVIILGISVKLIGLIVTSPPYSHPQPWASLSDFYNNLRKHNIVKHCTIVMHYPCSLGTLFERQGDPPDFGSAANDDVPRSPLCCAKPSGLSGLTI
jgi:hypothetical protein